MSEIPKKLKIPAIVIVVLIIGYFGYTTFIKGGAPTSTDQLVSTPDSNSVTQDQQEFLNLLLKIQNITIDTKIFDDPIFVSLVDKGRTISDQPKGRKNPFAPIVPGEGNADIVISTSTDATASTTAPTPKPTPTKKK